MSCFHQIKSVELKSIARVPERKIEFFLEEVPPSLSTR